MCPLLWLQFVRRPGGQLCWCRLPVWGEYEGQGKGRYGSWLLSTSEVAVCSAKGIARVNL